MGGAKKEFTASEAETIAESFRDLAKRLNCLAEEILALYPISSVCASLVHRIYLSYIYTPVIYGSWGKPCVELTILLGQLTLCLVYGAKMSFHPAKRRFGRMKLLKFEFS